jgi:hypothetical protein
MITIVIACDTAEDRRTAGEIEDWIRDGEFEPEVAIHVEGPS